MSTTTISAFISSTWQAAIRHEHLDWLLRAPRQSTTTVVILALSSLLVVALTTVKQNKPIHSNSNTTNTAPSSPKRFISPAIPTSPVPEWAIPARGTIMEQEQHFKGIHQTIFDPAKGNALQACIASILSIPLTHVPNFAAGAQPYDELRRYLATKGLGFIKIELGTDGVLTFAPFAVESLCVLAGRSPRGNFRHAIVAKLEPNGIHPVAVFDPHPDGTMVKSHDWVGLLVKVCSSSSSNN